MKTWDEMKLEGIHLHALLKAERRRAAALRAALCHLFHMDCGAMAGAAVGKALDADDRRLKRMRSRR